MGLDRPTDCLPMYGGRPPRRTWRLTQVLSTGAADFLGRTNTRCAAKGRILPLADIVAFGPQRASATSVEGMWAVERKLPTSLGVRHR